MLIDFRDGEAERGPVHTVWSRLMQDTPHQQWVRITRVLRCHGLGATIAALAGRR